MNLPGRDSLSETVGIKALSTWISRFVSHLLLYDRVSVNTTERYINNLLNYWEKAGLSFRRNSLLDAKSQCMKYIRSFPPGHKFALENRQLPSDLPGKTPCMWFDLEHIFANMMDYGHDAEYMCAISSLAFCTGLRASSAVTLTYDSIERILIDKKNPDGQYWTFNLKFIKGNHILPFVLCLLLIGMGSSRRSANIPVTIGGSKTQSRYQIHFTRKASTLPSGTFISLAASTPLLIL